MSVCVRRIYIYIISRRWRLWVVSLSRRRRKIAEKSVLMQTRPLLRRTNDFLLDGGVFFFSIYIQYIIVSPLQSSLRPAASPSVYILSFTLCAYTADTATESGATCLLIFTSNPLQQKYRRTNPTGLMCLKYRGSGNCNRNLVRRSLSFSLSHIHTHTHTFIIYRGACLLYTL